MINSKCIQLLLVSWSIYFICALFAQGDMLSADFLTELLIICFLISLGLGSIISNKINLNYKCLCFYKMSPLGNSVLKFSIYINILLSALVIVRSCFYQFVHHITLTRAELYSPITADGKLLSAVYVACLYLKGISSVILSFVFLKSLLDKNNKLTLKIVAILLLDAFVFTAKGPIINIGFIYLIYILINSPKNPRSYKKLLFGSLLIFVALWLIELIRGNSIVDSFVRYFAIGPVLLSSVVSGGFEAGYRSWSQSNIFLLFSGFDYLIVIFLRFLTGVPIQTAGYDWIKYIDMPLSISESAFKFFPSNTFYTLLAEPYLSFGFLGVIGIGITFGWIISSLERNYLLIKCERDLFWLQYIVNIVFFGVFVSAFSTVIFWLILGLMLFFSPYFFQKENF